MAFGLVDAVVSSWAGIKHPADNTHSAAHHTVIVLLSVSNVETSFFHIDSMAVERSLIATGNDHIQCQCSHRHKLSDRPSAFWPRNRTSRGLTRVRRQFMIHVVMGRLI